MRRQVTDNEIVQVANDNCPGQVVISGHIPALERAMEGAKAAGAKRAKALAVSIAAHSPLMDSIQSEWNDAVDACADERCRYSRYWKRPREAIASKPTICVPISKRRCNRVCAGLNQWGRCPGTGFRPTSRWEAGKSCWG